MLQIIPQMRILVAIEPVDGRKGIDSLARLCKQELAQDPFSGCVFIFINRSRTTLKALCYDGQGTGSRRSGCPKAASGGGRRETTPPGNWRPTKSRCCWLRETRG